MGVRNPRSLAFWTNRYATAPELGSGVGSDGYWKQRKLDILGQLMRRHQLGTVVDLGCGDLRVIADLPGFEQLDYVGVDFCPELLAHNRLRFPQHRFFQADLADVETVLQGIAPDLVICFDVLFHVEDDHTYDAVVRYLFNNGARAVALTCTVGQGPTNDVNIWHRDFEAAARRLGAGFVSRGVAPFRLPWERLMWFDLCEPSVCREPLEIVYVCSPARAPS